jgi:hypothetical protein
MAWAVYPDRTVLPGGLRATSLHRIRGAAIIRYWGESHAIAVPSEGFSFLAASRADSFRRRDASAASDEPMSRERTAASSQSLPADGASITAVSSGIAAEARY